MCGIAGVINYHTYDLEQLKKALLHRGPDEQAVYTEDNVALVHTRLSIVDIDRAHQPMHYGDHSIVFNGEIYNHKSLRAKLKEFTFQTDSDTETLLYLYIKYKEQMFELIDGMFSFAIWDKQENCLFLARDRAGKKPLYYTKDQNSFLFASELNAIKRVKPLDINEDHIYSYIRCGFFYKNTTPYANVSELEHGHYLKVNTNTLELSKKSYFDLLTYYQQHKKHCSLDVALSELDTRLTRSVEDRMLSSDLEVGAFLSGGIDSSLVVAIASQFTNRLKTFTVRFQGAYDECPLARLTAQKYQTDHKEIEVSMNLKKDIETILVNYGEPFMDSSAIPSYYVSKAAKEYVTVVLNGDGADELFGGYRRYIPFANHWVTMAKKLSFLTNLLKKPHEKKSYYNYLYRLLELAGKKDPLSRYLSATSDIYEGYEFHINRDTNEAICTFIQDVWSLNLPPLDTVMYLDFELLLFSVLLVKMDIASMANSLETRSPFLGKEILEFAPLLDNRFKIHHTTTKYILRELSKRYLPTELISQPKRGFEVPLKKWVEEELKETIYDALLPQCYSENFLQREFIDALLRKKISISDEKRAKILWNLFCLEAWRRNI